MNSKGQMGSIDLVLATIIFVALLIFIISFWFVTTLEIEKTVTKNILESLAVSTSDMLLKSPGVPSNWEENINNIQAIGLVSSINVLDKNKLANFTNLTYTDAKNLLGIDYEFYFYVEDLEENRLYEIGNSTLSGQAVSITRFAVLNNEKVRVRMMLHD